MAVWFYPGQEDYITKLNELGAIAELVAGQDGWSPTFAVAADGTRSVLQVVDWVGGEGTKPVTGKYVGAAGFVTLIADAVDIRGLKGDKGDEGDAGPINSLSIGTVVSGASASATISGTAPTQELNLVLPKGDNGSQGIQGIQGIQGVQGEKGDKGDKGDTGDNGAAATIAVGTVTTGAPGSSATVTNVGTTSAAVFDFTIPRGAAGTGSGDVVGPVGSVDNEVALFDGVSGKLVKGGGVLNTGAFTSADLWKPEIFTVTYGTPSVPNIGAGINYPNTSALAANGHTAFRTATGDVYTMIDGVWTLTNAFSVQDGLRVVSATYGQTAASGCTRFIIRAGGAVTGSLIIGLDSGAVPYTEAVPGVGWTTLNVRSKLNQIGRLAVLTTVNKTDIVAAINELVSSKLGDAPMDGKTYGRKDAGWVEAAGGDSAQIGDVRISTSPPATGTWLPCDGSIYLQSSYTSLFAELGLLANSPGSISGFTSANMTSLAQWKAVFYGGGMWVAVTGNGSSEAASSPDGITWTYRSMPSIQQWESVAYGNGVFVAVARGNGAGNPTSAAARSADGITWVGTSLPASAGWYSVSYGNGGFVAVNTASSASATSTDGTTWTPRTLPATFIYVSFVNGMFIATTGAATTTAYKSSDGLNWSAFTLPVSATWTRAAYGNNTFILLGGTTIAATSSDGVVWVQRTMPMAVGNIVYENGTFFAVSNSATNSVLTTADGITWTTRTLPGPAPSAPWAKPGYGDGKFVTVLANASPTNAVASTYAGITYDRGTQFAVPRLAATDGLTSRIKAL